MKEKFLKYRYNDSIIYVGNKNTLGVKTKEMVIPFLTDLKKALETMDSNEESLFNVPVAFVKGCVEDSKKKFSM